MDKKHVLSFCIFDDLYPMMTPIEMKFNELDELKILVDKMLMYKLKYENLEEYFEFVSDNIDYIVSKLRKKRYYVRNRYEKYYVIAFAIDYVRFEIYSKDCDKQLIKWREDDANDKIVGLIADENYNDNPVVRLMNQINRDFY